MLEMLLTTDNKFPWIVILGKMEVFIVVNQLEKSVASQK